MQMEIIDMNDNFDSLDMLHEVQLDHMVEVSLSEPVLKNNFELIIKVLREHKIQLRNLKLSERKQDEQISQNKDRIGQLEVENSQLRDQIEQLQEKLNGYEKKLQEFAEQGENQDGRIKVLEEKFGGVWEKVNELLEKWKMMAELNNSNASADLIVELKQQINQTKLNINEIMKQMQDFALKKDLDDANIQIEDNSKEISDLQKEIARFGNIDNLQTDINTLYQRLGHLENDIIPEKFKKVDSDMDKLNEDIEGLKLQINQVYELLNKLNEKEGKEIKFEMPAPQIDNSKLKATENRINDLEGLLKELENQLNQHLAEFLSFKDTIVNGFDKINKEKLNKGDFDLSSLMDQFHSVRALISTISNSLEGTNQKVEKNGDDIQILFSKLSQKMGQIKQIEQQRPVDNLMDEDQVMTLIQNFNNKLNDEFLKQIKEIKEILDTKADKSELHDLENRLMQLINEIFNKLSKFADKAETKKVLALLEKKINELYQMIAGDNTNNLDGLLVKRQLGWSCCSCNQDLDKYRGQLGDYLNWAIFPPKETIPQRMGKYAVHYANDIQAKKFGRERSSKLQTGDNNSQIPSTLHPQTTTAQHQTSDNFYPQLQSHQQNFEKYFMSTTGTNFAKKMPRKNNNNYALVEGQAYRPIHSVHVKEGSEESGMKLDNLKQ